MAPPRIGSHSAAVEADDVSVSASLIGSAMLARRVLHGEFLYGGVMDYPKEIIEQAELIHLRIWEHLREDADGKQVVQAIAAALVVFPMLRGIQREIAEFPTFKKLVDGLNEAHKERVQKARKT